MNYTKGTMEEVDGTWGQGSVCATYDELVTLFGFPFGASGDGKVQAEWVVKFDNGILATIYDWKQYDTATEDVVNWNIGGRSWQAEYFVQETLNANRPNI